MDGDDVRVPAGDQGLDHVRGHRPGAAVEQGEQPGGGPFGLGEDGRGEDAVAGDNVPGDLQLVEGQLDLPAVGQVRLEAGPVLDHQFAQLRQGEEDQRVVVGRVEQVALAAADLADGAGPVRPLLAGRAGRGGDPVLAVGGRVDRVQHLVDERAEPLLDQVEPDVGAAGEPDPLVGVLPLGAGPGERGDLDRPALGGDERAPAGQGGAHDHRRRLAAGAATVGAAGPTATTAGGEHHAHLTWFLS